MMNPPELAIAGYGATEFGLTGRALLPPPWNLPKEEIAKIMQWDKEFEQRVAEAQRLMAEAGYADGFKLRLTSRNNADFERILVTIGDHLQRHLNIETEIVMREVAEAMKLRDAGDFDLYWELCYALLGDPDEYTEYFTTDGSGNFGGYSNPELDKLFEKQSQTVDLHERIAIMQDIERIILTDLPILPSGVNYTYVMAWYPYVKNFTPAPTGYCQAHLKMEQVWLDK
jgi:ABC-type transport system substrate-binding protein